MPLASPFEDLHLPSHLNLAPERDFWVHQLSFARFNGLERRLDDPAWVEAEVSRRFTGLARELVEPLLAQAGDAVACVLQHLLLVGAYTERLKTAALLDVARATLPAPQVSACKTGRSRWSRAALALLLYLAEPRSLLSVGLCDRWHTLRRCVMKVAGRAPQGEPLTADAVEVAAREGLAGWAGENPWRQQMTLLQVFARRPGEILVGLRYPHGPGALLDEAGAVLTGFTPELLLLRFRERGHRVDLTATRLEIAVELAGAIGSQLLGRAVRYEKRRDPVTEQVLDAFLARLCDPDADDLRLVEIKAEMPGEPGRPVKTLHGPGRNRIEHTVQREAERSAFARDWRTVHSVKVWFEGYRFTVHFPAPGEGLDLTYSDLGRDTQVSERFEDVIEKLRDQFGADIRIAPRSQDPGGRRHRRSRDRAPRQLTSKHWGRLLGGVVDDPAPWEERRLERLREEGLLAWQISWYFRCGDRAIDRNGASARDETLDCSGRVEWENEDQPEDPYAALSELAIDCPECNHAWHLQGFRGPVHRRLRLSVRHEAAWDRVQATVGGAMEGLMEEAPGLASGLRRGQRLYLAWLPLVDPEQVRRRARGQPVAWFGPEASPELQSLGPSCDLAGLMTGRATWERALDTALDGDLAPLPVNGASTSLPVNGAAHAPQPSAPSRGLAAPPPYGVLFQVPGGGARFLAYPSGEELRANKPSQTWNVLRANAGASRLLLALLADAAAEDDGAGEARRFRSVESLTARHAVLRALVSPDAFYKWVKRTRAYLDRVAPGVGELVIEGGRDGDTHGYRLGSRYALRDFQLEPEIQNWKSREEVAGKS